MLSNAIDFCNTFITTTFNTRIARMITKMTNFWQLLQSYHLFSTFTLYDHFWTRTVKNCSVKNCISFAVIHYYPSSMLNITQQTFTRICFLCLYVRLVHETPDIVDLCVTNHIAHYWKHYFLKNNEESIVTATSQLILTG